MAVRSLSVWERDQPRRPPGTRHQRAPRRFGTVGAAVGGAVLVTLCATSCGSAPSAGVPTPTTATTGTAGTSTSNTGPPMATTTTDPGLLPQTSVEPPVDASLRTTLAPLWSAIVSGSIATGLPVFFPQSSYLQMKSGTLSNPAADYTDRLIAFYGLDIAAYHQMLVAGATTTLIAINATASDAAWIPAGSCENRIGYWHLPGVRLVYEVGGTVRSFAVASLISWRGIWYVVHLGPNPRPENIGTVDQPAAGPGTPGPAGGC